MSSVKSPHARFGHSVGCSHSQCTDQPLAETDICPAQRQQFRLFICQTSFVKLSFMHVRHQLQTQMSILVTTAMIHMMINAVHDRPWIIALRCMVCCCFRGLLSTAPKSGHRYDVIPGSPIWLLRVNTFWCINLKQDRERELIVYAERDLSQ